ncbi:molybdopterin dehydrogenase [Streptomyces sp. SID8361]|uniref:FAD binding domain-containing protein n=1 Tax=Streptomyces TaxID=1883 RepID=UPI00081DD665|nr:MULTISPECIES: FAD binding domain-containing protein [unclassified Streptomyces]AUA17187.1 6-hydroxypseudooxynicotine dehydrogenase complex subunit alpha [Streptomyces sp. M56]MYU15846.1 molybdopterin dehydrogenase [Streptomyces sp. SID8361]MYX56234.1 molybdopterin dehydrogenase [Streptomyces sp. SID8382]SCG10393.1 carbon-monoxide dehydrogenase medium subunit [Streptomyces sp. MnatMP-M27]
MKAAPFAYVRPATLAEAVEELVRADGGGKVISGGQSLTPVLAMRLARPEVLVDINAIVGLDRIDTGEHVEIGAAVRQRAVERSSVGARVPLLRMALPWVGHRELRSRGTVCGSLAHADPAAELPAVACCLDASLTLHGPGGARRIAARDFFSGAMMTALGPEELLTAVRLPSAARGDGFGFAEIARRHGDFALAGVAVRVRRGDPAVEATLTGFGISDRPVTRSVGEELVAALNDSGGEDGLRAALAERLGGVVEDMVDTEGDAHASRGYRRRLFGVLASREIAKAYTRAKPAGVEKER